MHFWKITEPDGRCYTVHRIDLANMLAKAGAAVTLLHEAERPQRPAAQIVAQTEEIAALLMSEIYSREAQVEGLNIRDSAHPRARHCWDLACRVQAMLTDADVENAVAELED